MTVTYDRDRAATPLLGKRANIALWTLQVLAAAFFALAGAFPKLTAHSSAVEAFDQIGHGTWFMYLVGSLELAGAVALLLPLLCGVAALAFIGLMIGAFTYELVVFGGGNAVSPLVVLVVMAIIAWWRRDRTARLFGLLAGRERGRA
ncbi:DoxX family protein [Haloechinothrix sp. YIM 98757]|uniref:DoxX family protein n=1 Tax=Haloechinothrix aidingensis TaxID=2752311 RepID=A0A838AE48_9PSEU|nr:DoxX family protein [Haloechinothrix aidingensis]MBA0127490.1 DoxX family protein [Haloechinothrix aidingensis]